MKNRLIKENIDIIKEGAKGTVLTVAYFKWNEKYIIFTKRI